MSFKFPTPNPQDSQQSTIALTDLLISSANVSTPRLPPPPPFRAPTSRINLVFDILEAGDSLSVPMKTTDDRREEEDGDVEGGVDLETGGALDTR